MEIVVQNTLKNVEDIRRRKIKSTKIDTICRFN